MGQGLTTADLGAVDFRGATRQYTDYVQALRHLGLEVFELPSEPAYPDAHFVEDTAVLFDALAIITRPGAPSRRGEESSVERFLAHHRPTVRIQAPGTLDGGDVLVVGDSVFVGLSERTNRSGFDQLSEFIGPLGYACHPIPVGAGLHLKSSVNVIGENRLLLTRDFEDHISFRGYDKILVPNEEAYGANVLFIDHTFLVPSGHPKTQRALSDLGSVKTLDMSEMQKMDGGLTCLSLRF